MMEIARRVGAGCFHDVGTPLSVKSDGCQTPYGLDGPTSKLRAVDTSCQAFTSTSQPLNFDGCDMFGAVIVT
jgi:hypothetical protein